MLNMCVESYCFSCVPYDWMPIDFALFVTQLYLLPCSHRVLVITPSFVADSHLPLTSTTKNGFKNKMFFKLKKHYHYYVLSALFILVITTENNKHKSDPPLSPTSYGRSTEPGQVDEQKEGERSVDLGELQRHLSKPK